MNPLVLLEGIINYIHNIDIGEVFHNVIIGSVSSDYSAFQQ